MRVSRCCCCFNLRYGYYTYAILSLICRLTAVIIFWASRGLVYAALSNAASNGTLTADGPQLSSLLVSVNGCTGWYVATTAIFMVGLWGIAQEKAVLIYPMIIVLVLELIISAISIVLLSLVIHPWFLLVFILMAINIYDLTCLISLFLLVNEKQNRQKDMYSTNI